MEIRIAPKAVCRQLLVNLNAYSPLSVSEERQIIAAIENLKIENGVDRLLAKISRNTLETIIDKL